MDNSIEFHVPYQYNLIIFECNKTNKSYIIGNTNDSDNWDTFKLELPKGKWKMSFPTPTTKLNDGGYSVKLIPDVKSLLEHFLKED